VGETGVSSCWISLLEACFVEPKTSKTFKVPLFTQNQYGDKKGPTPATWLGGCPFVHGSLGGLGGCEGFAMVLSPGVDNNI